MVRIISLLVGATLMVPVASLACGGGSVMSATKSDGTKVGLIISNQQIHASPSWNPEMGEPPLPVSEAYRLVKEWSKSQYSRYDAVDVREIALTEHGCSLAEDVWYYRVDLLPVFDGNRVWGGGNFAAVLMDGTVIGPTELD